jgi:hypothetical protein
LALCAAILLVIDWPSSGRSRNEGFQGRVRGREAAAPTTLKIYQHRAGKLKP